MGENQSAHTMNHVTANMMPPTPRITAMTTPTTTGTFTDPLVSAEAVALGEPEGVIPKAGVPLGA